jgi:acetylornithine deacetylase/succinyl-diaminopimelate desuccinylase-like protein
MRRVLTAALFGALLAAWPITAQTPDPTGLNAETLRHFQAIVRIDSSNPPGNETRVAEYVKSVLEAEGIPVTLAVQDPARANVIARLKGSGARRPLIIMGHSDVVKVDPAKWTFPPFGATRDDGYIYGRGTLDDRPDLVAAMMTMIQLKRRNVPLDRDVVFVSEAGEEASTGPGIEYLVNDRWSEIDADVCLAETGGVRRRQGHAVYATVQTAEKQPRATELVATGPSGHGSRPLRTNAVAHLARAVAALAEWEPPTRFNETTRAYFEGLAKVTDAATAARYRDLFSTNPARAAAAREYLAEHEPGSYSMLHTSISPTMLTAGYQINVIPSEARATLDIRALPGQDMGEFYELMRRVINDPMIRIVANSLNQRPAADASRIDSDAYRAIEAAYRTTYNVATVPQMATGATDMAFLRAKGVQCYGVGPMVDEEDAALGFGSHSDQERILEEAVYKHVAFFWEAVTAIAGAR